MGKAKRIEYNLLAMIIQRRKTWIHFARKTMGSKLGVEAIITVMGTAHQQTVQLHFSAGISISLELEYSFHKNPRNKFINQKFRSSRALHTAFQER